MTKTILLVDDEPNILRTLMRLLRQDGYKILLANSADEGLTLLANNTVQVIISDQRMPNMVGSEFLKKVNHLYPETIRMILSAYSDFDAMKDAINEGAIYKFINKPWDDEILRHFVREAFEAYTVKNEGQATSINISKIDKLTKLPNRYFFTEILLTAIYNAKINHSELAVICLDLDRFGYINDSLGQECGDKVLLKVTEQLTHILANQAEVVRLGNDEFAALITKKEHVCNLKTILETIEAIFSQPFNLADKNIYISASIGACLYPAHGDNPNLLIKHAYAALHYCKKLGGNNYKIYDESLDMACEDKIMLETDLHHALERNEFVLHFQPIVDIATHTLLNVEALLRWQHPRYGLIFPNRFLSLCEETGLIVPIGRWIITTVCQQIIQWRDMGHPNICVAVNLSSRQFHDSELLNFIINTLQTTKIPPSCLEFEITESLVIENIESNIALLKSLSSLGIKLAIDDFGTGYSALSYLKNFPFNVLKIDKSFIDDVVNATDSAAIVNAIITLGKSLGMKIIAEGVEKQVQLDYLKDHQCDLMQGYLYSKPLCAEDLTILLKQMD